MATEKKKSAPAKTVQRKQEVTPKTEAVKTVQSKGAATRKIMVGTVVSDKMQKTIVVKIDRRVRHALYKKYVTQSRRFKAHDEKNEAKVGDLVCLVETRPMSRDKRWALQKIVRRAGQALEASV